MIKAKKSLGQNFLKSEAVLRAIAEAADISPTDTVLEIGPGQGALTKHLLERAGKVIAVEKDERLVEYLRDNFKFQISNDKLEIICGDILEVEKLTENYVLVGNIPYYITGAIFKKFLQSDNQPKSMTLLVQKEVAERIMAKPARAGGGEKESILSISVKVFGEPRYVKTVKRGSFSPPPKVDSAVIKIENINRERLAELTSLTPLNLKGESKIKDAEKRFFEILKKGFSHKRKLLSKNLGIEKEILKECGIAEKARAEDLTVDNWICLAKKLV